jgi:hypothetical protein
MTSKYANFRNGVGIALWVSWAVVGCAGRDVSERNPQPPPVSPADSPRPEPARAPAVPIIVEHSPGTAPPALEQAGKGSPAERPPPQLSPVVVTEPLAPQVVPAPATVPGGGDAASPPRPVAPEAATPRPGGTSAARTQPAAPLPTGKTPPLDATEP